MDDAVDAQAAAAMERGEAPSEPAASPPLPAHGDAPAPELFPFSSSAPEVSVIVQAPPLPEAAPAVKDGAPKTPLKSALAHPGKERARDTESDAPTPTRKEALHGEVRA
jgi:hypothetical protein